MASSRALTTLKSALCALANLTTRQRESTVQGLASGWLLPRSRCKSTLRHHAGWMEPGSIPALLTLQQDTFIQGTTYPAWRLIHWILSPFPWNLECLWNSHWPIHYGSGDIMWLRRQGLRHFSPSAFILLECCQATKATWREGASCPRCTSWAQTPASHTS